MDFITSVLKDFYECCNLPVKAISYNFDTFDKIGYSDYFESIYPSKKIEDTIISSEDDDINVTLEIKDDIYYNIVNISKLNKSKGYFILGPITTNPNGSHLHKNIPYRSLDCFYYMSRMILDICSDKLNKKINNNFFNPYVRKAIEYVHENYNEDITIESLCNYLDINKCYFCSLFKKSTGQTFSQFLNYFRVEKSKKLLLSTNLNLLDIAISVGYNNQNYYSMVFKKLTNKNPSQYRVSSKL